VIAPAARYLSLGAGIQSSTCLLLAVQGKIASFDAAVFADTGWEPAAVYTHLDRLERLAAAAGIPVVSVSTGDIRADALDPAQRFASMPLFTLGPNGERGMARRQCSSEYKIKPIKAEVRRRLGYPHPQRIPAGLVAEISIGISVDEVHRARDADVAYMGNAGTDRYTAWAKAHEQLSAELRGRRPQQVRLHVETLSNTWVRDLGPEPITVHPQHR
jgi:hypothetical protein